MTSTSHHQKSINVLLADDHTILRQGLRSLLESEQDINVVGEAENGQQAVTMARNLRPTVVVMDIAMPIMNGMQATRIIKKKYPETKIIILSMYTDEDFVTQVVQLGASGYLVKQTAATDLINAIREVTQGNAYFSPSISRLIAEKLKQVNDNKTKHHLLYALTTREEEVLQLISEGKSNKDISIHLDISIKTVEKHREHIMRKLDIHDVAGLTRYAFSRGIISGTVTSQDSAG